MKKLFVGLMRAPITGWSPANCSSSPASRLAGRLAGVAIWSAREGERDFETGPWRERRIRQAIDVAEKLPRGRRRSNRSGAVERELALPGPIRRRQRFEEAIRARDFQLYLREETRLNSGRQCSRNNHASDRSHERNAGSFTPPPDFHSTDPLRGHISPAATRKPPNCRRDKKWDCRSCEASGQSERLPARRGRSKTRHEKSRWRSRILSEARMAPNLSPSSESSWGQRSKPFRTNWASTSRKHQSKAPMPDDHGRGRPEIPRIAERTPRSQADTPPRINRADY